MLHSATNPSRFIKGMQFLVILCFLVAAAYAADIGPCIGDTCPVDTGATCTNGRCITSTTPPSTTCVDKKKSDGTSDCTRLSYLCNDANYYNLMTEQCPKTCNRCNATSTPSTTCVDKTKSDGTSDCTRLSYLCNDANYYNLMTEQCPKTCNRCPTSG